MSFENRYRMCGEAIFRMPNQSEQTRMGLEPGVPLVEVHRSDGSTPVVDDHQLSGGPLR